MAIKKRKSPLINQPASIPESKLPRFSSLPTFKLETLSSISIKHGELHFQRLFGLRLIECRILGVVAFYGPVTLRQLCIEIGLEKSQGSRFVARLVGTGLLERYDDPEDQRSFYLLLTRKGLNLRNQINLRSIERNRNLMDCLSKEQNSNFMKCLESLTVRARAMLDEEILHGGHEIPPQPIHELAVEQRQRSQKNENKPVLIEPAKLRKLYQQVGELLGIKTEAHRSNG